MASEQELLNEAGEIVVEAISRMRAAHVACLDLTTRTEEFLRNLAVLNTRPAPAATDTGLETVIKKAEKELLERIADTYGDSIANDIADYLGRIGDAARSRAEELLAAKDEEISAIAGHLDCEADSDSILHTIREIEADKAIYKERAEKAEAVNAAQAARIKELEQELTDRKHGGRWSEMVEALEAKLSAAKKALKPFATDADIYDDQDIEDGEKSFNDNITVGDLRKARAVLGGKL